MNSRTSGEEKVRNARERETNKDKERKGPRFGQ